MKDAQQQIEVQLELIDICEDALLKAQERKDWIRFSTNFSTLFDEWHYCLLVACRSRDTRGPIFLNGALRVAARVAETKNESGVDAITPGAFPFEAANFLQILNTTVGADVSCYEMNYTKIQPFSDRHLSVLLFEKLVNQPTSEDWGSALERLKKKKTRASLAVETYATYGRIIDAVRDGNVASAHKEVVNAAELFQQRASNAYFQGGSAVQGGGDSNRFVVDYELAAIQRRLFSAPIPGAEVHWWPW